MSSLNAQSPAESQDPAAIAAGWVERLTAGDPDPADLAELREWLAADPAHRRAYEQARALWIDLPEAGLARRRRAPLRLVAGGALAACLAFVALGWSPHDRTTATGEVRRLTLPDGSIAWLDSDSAVDLAFDAERRTLHLARGRVAVTVAKDAARPFAVEAGDATITDIGTTFSVDRTDGLRVAVAEGLVDVARGGRTVRIGAGEAGLFDTSSPRLLPRAMGDFAWRDGRILLDDMPLDRALAELDRYFPGRIVLLDGDLAGRRVSGALFAGRVEDGVEAVARSEGLRVTHLPWLIVIAGADAR